MPQVKARWRKNKKILKYINKSFPKSKEITNYIHVGN